MKTIISLITTLCLACGLASAAPTNKECPMCVKPASATSQTAYSKTVALCCNRCKAQFDAAPKGYLSSILSAVTGQCPLSKKKISTPVNVTYKRDVAFCSADCKAKFDAAPDKFIKEVR